MFDTHASVDITETAIHLEKAMQKFVRELRHFVITYPIIGVLFVILAGCVIWYYTNFVSASFLTGAGICWLWGNFSADDRDVNLDHIRKYDLRTTIFLVLAVIASVAPLVALLVFFPGIFIIRQSIRSLLRP